MFEVSKIMSADIVTVSTQTPIYEAMAVLIEHRLSGVPVVDDEQNLLGIITEKDMLKLLFDTDTILNFPTLARGLPGI